MRRISRTFRPELSETFVLVGLEAATAQLSGGDGNSDIVSVIGPNCSGAAFALESIAEPEGISIVSGSDTLPIIISSAFGFESLELHAGSAEDEILHDNENCRLNQIAIEIFGQDGADRVTVIPCRTAPFDPPYQQHTVIGREGSDLLKLINKADELVEDLHRGVLYVMCPRGLGPLATMSQMIA